jgi:hypothetical protein
MEWMVEKKTNFILKMHRFYSDPVTKLKAHVRSLKEKLSDQDYKSHPDVKFAKRLRDATETIIPNNPDLLDYRLHGDLKLFRRYKKGIQRYRLFYCFSSTPRIIVYLYLHVDILPSLKEGDSCASQHKFLFHRQLPLD